MVAHQVPHKVDHIKDTHADVQIQGGESSTQEEAGTQPIAKAQVDVNGDASGNEVANIPLPCREDRHEDPSASHVHGGANATDTREEADNSGGTDNLQLRGNVRQVHPASKWDRVSGQVPHFQQHNSPSHLGQVQYQKDPYRGEECTSMVSHSGLVRHQKDPCRCEETSQQQECGVIQEGHCPGHKKAPEQELVLGQAHSSNEGIITANVVSKQGDYTQQQDWGEDGAKKATEEELDITATTMAAGGGQKIVVLPNILFAPLGYGAMYNQHTACLTNQVSFSTLTNVMLPSQSWTDAITMPHHVEWVRVRDPGPKEGEACHYSARYYPYQREEGRRHCLGPCQQNGHYNCHCVRDPSRHCSSQQKKLRPRDLNWSVLQSPNSEASNKKMYFASEHVYANMNKLVQCYNTVKLYKNFVNITLFLLVFVCVITLVFKLLICNRAMCLNVSIWGTLFRCFVKKGCLYSVLFAKKMDIIMD